MAIVYSLDKKSNAKKHFESIPLQRYGGAIPVIATYLVSVGSNNEQ
jgi:hypothetical protein